MPTIKKPKFRVSCENPRSHAQHHFYASSCARWETSEDLGDLVAKMKREPYPFFVMLVPLPLKAPYQISNYSPVVEGCIWLAHYDFEVNHG